MLFRKFFTLLIFISSALSYGEELKIISLSPNLTEIIFLLKKGSNLTGRSSVCCSPQDALKIPIAGNLGDPNLEKVISLRPDAIVLTMVKDMSKVRILKNLGIKVHIFQSSNISQYLETVRTLGEILNAKEAAEKEIERVKNKISELERGNLTITDDKKPKVFWVVWDNPIITIGKKSFIDEYICLAGGKSITGNINKSYFYTSKENIISAKPNVIIAPNMKISKIEELKTVIGWKSLPAVKEKRVYGNIDPNLVYILGPRMFDAISLIHNCLYPNE